MLQNIRFVICSFSKFVPSNVIKNMIHYSNMNVSVLVSDWSEVHKDGL